MEINKLCKILWTEKSLFADGTRSFENDEKKSELKKTEEKVQKCEIMKKN